jgi:hypothetical protein
MTLHRPRRSRTGCRISLPQRPPVWLLLALWLLPALSAAEAVEPAPYVCGSRHVATHYGELPLPRAKLSGGQQTPDSVRVGTELEFLVAGDLYLRAGTCQYVGEHCYIFVENAQWDTNGGSVFQSDVDALGQLFDHATPADPERGMYELETQTFGPVTDVDGHQRIFVFVVELVDARLVGFFDPRVATWPDPALRRDTLYLDAGYLRGRPYLSRGTLAHEFQHLLHYGLDPDEESWINEGLSGYAEALTGFPESDTSMVDAFLDQPDFDLTVWPPTAGAANYGATYLFAAFLAERFGPELISALVAEPRNGTFGVDEALRTAGRVDSFDSVWGDWIVANYASDDDVNGYAALGGRRIRTYAAPPLPFDSIEGVVNRRWGTTAVMVRPQTTAPGNVSATFEGEDSGRYSVFGYAMRGATGELVPMELDGGSAGTLDVAEVDSLVVIIGRTSPLGRSFWLSAKPMPPTAVADMGGLELPVSTRLLPGYPNPFNGAALIPFALHTEAPVSLSVHDLLGRRVRSLVAGKRAPGSHLAAWDGRDQDGRPVASGTYLIRLKTADGERARKLTLVR